MNPSVPPGWNARWIRTMCWSGRPGQFAITCLPRFAVFSVFPGSSRKICDPEVVHFHRVQKSNKKTKAFRLTRKAFILQEKSVLRDYLLLVVRATGLAYPVRNHKSSALAAFNKCRRCHFPVCSSFISSSLGRLILRTDWHT